MCSRNQRAPDSERRVVSQHFSLEICVLTRFQKNTVVLERVEMIKRWRCGGGRGRHPLTAELLFQEVEILDMNTIRDTRTGKYAKQPKVGPLC